MSYQHTPHRMEIWFADLGGHPGTSVQEGIRLVLVISNDISNEHGETITVLPMTPKLKKRWLPCHVSLNEEDMIISQGYHASFDPSIVLMEQITTIDKNAFHTLVGFVRTKKKKTEISDAVIRQLEVNDAL